MNTIITNSILKDYTPLTLKNIYNNGSKLYLSSDKKTLLKMCYDTSYKKLSYFANLKFRWGCTYPLQIFETDISDFSSAYTMNYYASARMLNDPFLSNLSLYHKKLISLEFLQILQNLNTEIVLGDIHLNNLMLYHGNALICDWDSYQKLEEDLWINSLYYINDNDLVQSAYTDVVKMLISIFSFYFQYDLESYFIYGECDSFIDIFRGIMSCYPSLRNILDMVINEFFNNVEFSCLDPIEFVQQLPDRIYSNKYLSKRIQHFIS